MNVAKFDQMYKFLFDYKCEINKNVPDNLKCDKCKNILINACQVPCGCRYCRDCVNEMLENGVDCCPGNTDDCKDEYLSHNHLDYRANKKISKLVLKCPEQMCLHQCELIDMDEHMRICGKKTVKCPFFDFGCVEKKMVSDSINEHCQLENFNHSKILIEIIDNIRNEIDGLKEKEEKNKNEIEKLIQNLKVKDEIIDSINEEVKELKLEKKKLFQEFESFKEKLGDKIENISVEMKNKNLQSIESNRINNAKLAEQVNISKVELEKKIGGINEKIERHERMKMERDEYKRDYKNLEESFERKTEKILIEIQKEKQARIKSFSEETKSIKTSMVESNKKLEMGMETRINELSKSIEIPKSPPIEWTIDKLDERRNKDESINGEFFTGMIEPYKFRLDFWANGGGDFRGKGCSIYLLIHPSEKDKSLPWPFKADVTMKIVNKTNSNVSKSITKYFEMDKPSSNFYYSSNRFDYSYSDLTKTGVIAGNCFIVKCFVNFK